jgi:hypothetical protein
MIPGLIQAEADHRVDLARSIERVRDHDRAPVLAYRPILDVPRRVAAGYGVYPDLDAPKSLRTLDVAQVEAALHGQPSLPAGTFLLLPIAAADMLTRQMRATLLRPRALRGVVVEIVGLSRGTDIGTIADEIRGAGGTLALAGGESGQPGLCGVIGLRPTVIALGRDWIRDIENSTRKQMMVETVGRLASTHDAWILADDVRTEPELRTLAELGVSLAQGPFIGAPQHGRWPSIPVQALTVTSLRPTEQSELRELVRPVLTARSADEAMHLAANIGGAEYIVVVDANLRPALLVDPNQVSAPKAPCPLDMDTPLGEALGVALSRPEAERELPIAATDGEGRFVGLVTMQALTRRLGVSNARLP